MSAPTFSVPGTPRNPHTAGTPAAARAVRRGRFAIDVQNHQLLDLHHGADLPQQRGIAGGRYHCPACQGLLAFSGRRTCDQYTPRFTHRYLRGRHRCPAPVPHLRAIQAGQNLSASLRDRLGAEHPRLLTYLEPGSVAYPPTLVLRTVSRTTVIHPLLTAPSQDAARARVQDSFRRHGAKTVQLWLLPWQPPDTAVQAADYPAGAAYTTEVTMEPSPMHRTVALQGAAVGWLDGDQLWLPPPDRSQRRVGRGDTLEARPAPPHGPDRAGRRRSRPRRLAPCRARQEGGQQPAARTAYR